MKRSACGVISTTGILGTCIVAIATVLMASPFDAKSSGRPIKAADLEEFLPPGVEVFDLKYISIGDFAGILSVLELKTTKYTPSDQNGQTRVYIRFEDPSSAERARRLLAKLDIPPRRIEVRFLQVLASNESYYEWSRGSRGDKYERPVPNESLLEQLKLAFKFRQFNLIHSFRMTLNAGINARTQSRPSRIQLGDASGEEKLNILSGHASFSLDFIDDGKGVIQIRNLSVQAAPHVLNTSLNVKNGETIIVGSSSLIKGNNELITVVTARTVD